MKLRETKKFKSTNSPWNDLKLNHSWSIGYITKLFKDFNGKDSIEWERFYYQSGEKRLKEIENLPVREKEILLNRSKTNSILLSPDKLELNTSHGRTENDLKVIAKDLYEHLLSKGNSLWISEEECLDFVKIRVLDEIFVGVEREINTIKRLSEFFPYAEFRAIPVEFDSYYAIDVEVYVKNILKLAIQIKSIKYRDSNSKTLRETKHFNKVKNNKYSRKFKANVLYVYSNRFGKIENPEILASIHRHLIQ